MIPSPLLLPHRTVPNGTLPPFDPLRAELRADPYPWYAEYRTVSPVSIGVDGTRYLFRHADVRKVLADKRFGRRPTGYGTASVPEEHRVFYGMIDRFMLFLDPPDHTRVRSILQRSFTREAVEAMRPRIVEIAHALLDAVIPAGELDVIADVGYPLPVLVIADLLGFPREDRLALRELSAAVTRGIDTHTTHDELVRADRAARELTERIRALVAERVGRPRGDLLSVMVQAHEGGYLNEDELVANAVFLLLAGHETTAHLVGNGALALLEHPDQLDLLSREGSRLDTAVEELLRYDGPVQVARRWPTEDVVIAERLLPAGEPVCALLGSANRDPGAYSDPERLDLRRAARQHVAFGSGIHFCLGAHLARLEATIAFEVLTQRLQGLARTPEPLERIPYVGLRGLRSLRLTFEASAAVR
jgi:cytochrome P450